MIDPHALGLPVIRLLRRISAAMILVAAWQAVFTAGPLDRAPAQTPFNLKETDDG